MAKEYIEREAVIELFNKWADGYSYIEVPTKDAIACVRVIPAAAARSVRHGRWEKIEGQPHIMMCAVCKSVSVKGNYNFCPNCGARMDLRNGDRE